jgi:Mg-chelatase subunit ChlD
VGAAHSFERAKLASVASLDFELGRSRERAAAASRVLVEPGLAFTAPGGSLATDLVVFALDAAPSGARVLEVGAAPQQGDRVRLLGIPGNARADADAVYGRVHHADANRLEVELDVRYDLRGWGGAPVVSHPDGRAIGVVQGAVPSGKTLRVTATPIAAVTAALARPLEGGRGRAFAALAGAAAAPPPAPAETDARAARSASPPVVIEAAPKPREAKVNELRGLRVEIEQPTEGAVFGDELGAFLAGHAIAPLGEVQPLDVVFVIDTSGSTSAPSGMDVNGNGVVGSSQLGAVGNALGLGSTDPGDTILAAEVAAANQFLKRLDPRRTRVCLVSFAGEDLGNGRFEVVAPDSAITEVGLTNQYAEIERALARVLRRGPSGLTHMAAGVDQATIELKGLQGAFSRANPKSEKIVVFLTDGQPVMPRAGPTEAVVRAAERARRAGIRFYTYGIGEEALEGPLALIQLADTTGGTFTPVREAARLPELMAEVDFADIAELTVRNVTLGEPAHAVEMGADGSFGAMVPLKPGKNEIEVTAVATDGRQASDKVNVQYAPGAPAPPLPPELVASRNRMLELRLAQIKQMRVDVEAQQAERAREQLRIEIEKERATAVERAERQRKELELKIERERQARERGEPLPETQEPPPP